MLKIAQLPIRLPIVAQRRSARCNRFAQHIADDGHKGGGIFHIARKAGRGQAGAVQHFADIDIAKPRHDALIQQRRFDRGFAPSKARRKIRPVKAIAQRLWPKTRQQGMRLGRFGFHQIHRAKTAGVVKGNLRPARHMQHDMVMLLRGGMGVDIFAKNRPRHQHPPRHAQMDQQRLARIQICQNILRPPPQRQNPRARQPRGHIGRKRPAQIGTIDLCPFNHAPLHRGQKPRAHGFHFGQFGHFGLWTFGRIEARQLPPYKWRNCSNRQEQMNENSTTHFGFQTVPEGDKAGMVHGVFTRVASKYDIMNDLMSAGMHRLWKDAMMDWLAPRAGQKLLDVAGGTGDVAFRFLGRAAESQATVLDMTESMLIAGRARADAEALAARLDWVVGDAMALPFADNSFDVYTISFGIRNVTRIPDALREAYRVLRPGGRLMVLEFSQIPNDLAQWVYDKYSFNVIPVMGQIVANDRDSYQYLVESIRKFPNQETFAAMIRSAGFDLVNYRNLSMGIAALHSGWKT